MNAMPKSDRQIPAAAPTRNEPAREHRQPQRPFDYGGSYGSRCGYSNGRSYSDIPGRNLFHCA